MSDIYRGLSEERKRLQAEGLVPYWMTTAGYQLFKDKYLYDTDRSFRGQAERIAKTAAKHLPKDVQLEWEDDFFYMIWNGWVSCSTPVLANMGTDRGLPVSCSGQSIGDSIDEFYGNLRESAILTKHGFGTSGYLGNVRHRGAPISIGGTASGVVPVLKNFVQCMRDIAQGTTRRGAWAGYYPIDGVDFDELVAYLKDNPDDCNVGWNVSNAFIDKLVEGDEEASSRFAKAMKVKLVTGKGYFYFSDKVAELQPQCYKDLNLRSQASNLCTEITLHSDEDHTYTCVLSSINLALVPDYMLAKIAYRATVFLDCVASEFIERAKNIKGLEKAVRATEKGRALGLGVCGFHTYLQNKSIPFESLEAQFENTKIFKTIQEQSYLASNRLAGIYGEPEWCEGTGMRNTHTMAVAPTMSTALIMGGVSQGIEPFIGNAFIQSSAGGEMERVNPSFLKLAKERGKYTKALVKDIADKYGSVQHLDWLTDHEKLVYRTAFEINQDVIIRLAAQRQKYIDQAQSINLFFSAEEDERRIVEVHKQAFTNPLIKSLYYLRTQAGVTGSNGECVACQ